MRTRLASTLVFVWVLLGLSRSVAGQERATFVYPQDQAVNVDLSRPLEWTTVPGAQAYYLWVGTLPFTTDLINSGETNQTSLPAPTLPAARTLYAVIWTKLDGIWWPSAISFTTQAVAASWVHPANDGASVDLSQLLEWTSVPNAQAYYLWVGTSPGAKDLVNTGEIQQTTHPAWLLPSDRAVYATLWTKVGGAWRSAERAFATAPTTARFLHPADAAANVDPTRAFEWTAVPNAQVYYLWVGTSPGAKDLVNTGEIQQTSYSGSSLPPGQVLYASIWTKTSGVWRSDTVTFTTHVLKATWIHPVAGAANVNQERPFEWTAVPDAQAYYLWVGTSPGAKDVVNTGELSQTSCPMPPLPPGQNLYASLWTKVGGVWRATDISFTTPSVAAAWIFPTDGAVDVNLTRPLEWTTVPNVEAYYLWVGSAPGGSDLVNTGEIHETSYPGSALPADQTLHATIWAKVGGIWRSAAAAFMTIPLAARFVYPADGDVAVRLDRPFEWTNGLNTEAYYLWVGTAPGRDDLVNSGELIGNSFVVPSLPFGVTLYARIWSRVDGIWGPHSDAAFSLAPSVSPSRIVVPADGSTNFDAANPFQWTSVDLARAYRLRIGTAPGAADVHDSGEIRVTRRFVENLPASIPLYGVLQSEIDGQWHETSFTFSAVAGAPSMANKIDAALWATGLVRAMGEQFDNRPFAWTELWDEVHANAYAATCVDYARVLLSVLGQMNLNAAARMVDVAFNSNADLHTLVELLNVDSQSWILLDPTFGLSVRRVGDGAWATAEDVRAATRALDWGQLSFVMIASGDGYARRYYLDYPLLYLDVYHEGQPIVAGQGQSPLPYLEEVNLPVAGASDVYVLKRDQPGDTQVLIDNELTTVTCNGVDSLSPAFYASSISAPEGPPGSLRVFRPRRFVF